MTLHELEIQTELKKENLKEANIIYKMEYYDDILNHISEIFELYLYDDLDEDLDKDIVIGKDKIHKMMEIRDYMLKLKEQFIKCRENLIINFQDLNKKIIDIKEDFFINFEDNEYESIINKLGGEINISENIIEEAIEYCPTTLMLSQTTATNLFRCVELVQAIEILKTEKYHLAKIFQHFNKINNSIIPKISKYVEDDIIRKINENYEEFKELSNLYNKCIEAYYKIIEINTNLDFFRDNPDMKNIDLKNLILSLESTIQNIWDDDYIE